MSQFPVSYDALVTNLPYNVTDLELKQTFARFGPIVSTMIRDSKAGDGSKIGYVRFQTEDSLERAVRECINLSINSSKVLVKRASKKEPRRDAHAGSGDANGYSQGGQGGFGGRQGNKPDVVRETSEPLLPTPLMNDSNFCLPTSIGESMLFISHVETSCIFWGSLRENADIMAKLEEDLNQICLDALHIQGKPVFNKIYGCQFSLDQNWYRCRLFRPVSDTESEILYVDYGNKEIVENRALVELFGSVIEQAPMAAQYWLFYLKPVDNELALKKGKEILEATKEKGAVHAIIFPTTFDGMIPVKLKSEHEGTDINKELTELKLTEHLSIQELRYKFRNEHQSELAASPNRYHTIPPVVSNAPVQDGRFAVPPANYAKSGVKPLLEVSFKPETLNQNEVQRKVVIEENQGRATFGIPVSSSKSSAELASSELQRMKEVNEKLVQEVQNYRAEIERVKRENRGREEADRLAKDNLVLASDKGAALNEAQKYRAENEKMKKEKAAALAEAQKYRNEVERLTKEKGAVHVEIQMYRSELEKNNREKRLMSDENASLVRQNQKDRDAIKSELRSRIEKEKMLELQLEALQEMTVTRKIKDLILDSSKISKLRAQFSTDDDVQDVIEQAADVVSGYEHLMKNFLIMKKIATLQENYEQAQASIRSWKSGNNPPDRTTMDYMLTTRNTARQDLHSVLSEFIVTADAQPLAMKLHLIQSILEKIETTYESYLSNTTGDEYLNIKEVLKDYQSWKALKRNEFKVFRKHTNRCQSELVDSLALVQLQLSGEDNSAPMPDLDDLIKSYRESMSNEIENTNQESLCDASIISRAVRALVSELRHEAQDLSNIIESRETLGKRCVELGHWLNKSPDVSRIRVVCKSIKNLKSKIRHRLADKQDLEEEGHGSLAEIESDLNDLRNSLHEQFIEEDALLMELAHLSTDHFPELVIQFPEFSIANAVEYKGLVKVGRLLDHFTLENVDGKSTVHRSTFCKRNVILKEYAIGEAVGISYSDFLSKVVAFNAVASNSVIRLDCIFFDMNDRRAVIQLPVFEHSLAQVAVLESVKTEDLYKVLFDVLQGLAALHAADVVHGSLNPDNIFIQESGRGLIADFDFTKTLMQRVEKSRDSTGKWNFSALESGRRPSGTSSAPSYAYDMYNFGLILLWLYNTKKHNQGNNIKLDLHSLEAESEVKSMIGALLKDVPTPASELLKNKFWVAAAKLPTFNLKKAFIEKVAEVVPSGDREEKREDEATDTAADDDLTTPTDDLELVDDIKDVEVDFPQADHIS